MSAPRVAAGRTAGRTARAAGTARAARALADLPRLALEARERAYAPYSRFRVGAAVLAADGRAFAAANVENAAYPLSLCAERAAVAAAASAGARRIVAVAIASGTTPPTPPCGACRQVLREFGADMDVVLVNARGQRIETRLAILLPSSFGPEMLPR